ncbi:MAG: putative baseplate assembly protein [Gemmatimonadetes bacterium]|nr:putative baseplate assembly protein [Gemmatimonadota bacterium]
MTVFRCCDDERRAAVLRHGALNGIDWLEVVDRDAAVEADRQRFLRVGFIKPPGALAVTPASVRITGGERIPSVEVVGTSFDGDVLVVEVAEPGDFSRYQLSLTDPLDPARPLAGLDAILSRVEFSFKVECDTPFDCPTDDSCPPDVLVAPDIDYLARDYPALRQLLLDRLNVLHPGWTDRSPADVGVMLVELLAYVGDRLAWQQDAVATEAYIGTARRRVSVRRHARLIDYPMHDGCNARAWVHLQAGADDVAVPYGTPLLTRMARQEWRLAPDSLADLVATHPGTLVFETMHAARLFTEQNAMRFYTWGGARCCLPRGATRATLDGHRTSLTLVEPDEQVLIFEEVKGPRSGREGDADPGHRHAVRLKRVTLTEDPLGGQLHADPAQRTDAPVPITEIEWVAEDALPFPLCVSAEEDGERIDDVSVARGNIVLADHGWTRPARALEPVVPAAQLAQAAGANDPCRDTDPAIVPQRFTPRMPELPITVVCEYDHEDPPPARDTLTQDPREALAAITLRTSPDPLLPDWLPIRDLLAAGPTSEAFVVELEDDGATTLRFGDGVHGRRPPSGETLTATYRLGTGATGNVGADAIAHVLSSDSGLVRARNPLAATGGTDPESTERVREIAPAAFRTQQRAVTPADHEEVARAAGGIQQARARPRWTGSWRTMLVTVDPEGGEVVAASVGERVLQHLDRYRMAGGDVAVRRPRYVPLEIELDVCVDPDFVAADVEVELRERLGTALMSDGTRGLFHADNFTLGQPIWLSQVYGAVHAVEDISSVEVTVFRRLGDTGRADLDAGSIRLGFAELPRLANDPNFPERGVLTLIMRGGK